MLTQLHGDRANLHLTFDENKIPLKQGHGDIMIHHLKLSNVGPTAEMELELGSHLHASANVISRSSERHAA